MFPPPDSRNGKTVLHNNQNWRNGQNWSQNRKDCDLGNNQSYHICHSRWFGKFWKTQKKKGSFFASIRVEGVLRGILIVLIHQFKDNRSILSITTLMHLNIQYLHLHTRSSMLSHMYILLIANIFEPQLKKSISHNDQPIRSFTTLILCKIMLKIRHRKGNSLH